MSSAYSKSAAVSSALIALDQDVTPDRTTLRDAVRALLADLSRAVPGRSVEVRVPPFGAIQCLPGPKHSRGTPPNVIEMDAVTWLRLATGRIGWAEAVNDGNIRVSGPRANLAPYLPLTEKDS